MISPISPSLFSANSTAQLVSKSNHALSKPNFGGKQDAPIQQVQHLPLCLKRSLFVTLAALSINHLIPFLSYADPLIQPTPAVCKVEGQEADCAEQKQALWERASTKYS